MYPKAARKTLRGKSIALTLIAVLTVGVAHAQSAGILTSDIKSELEEHLQTAKQIEQFAKQIQQYAMQVQQYEQMLTKVMNLGTDFSIMPTTMQAMEPGPLIQANCSNGSASIAAGNILNSVTLMVDQTSITKNQQVICAAIITTQVDKYNATIQMMDQIQSNIPAVQKFTNLASTFSNMGESSSATTQINSYSSQLATAMNNWKTHMDADDNYISSLQSMQSTLGRAALRAKPDLMGNAVQAAALTAAFSYQPSL